MQQDPVRRRLAAERIGRHDGSGTPAPTDHQTWLPFDDGPASDGRSDGV